jgi:O-antigen chain-terminating methyltransferase
VHDDFYRAVQARFEGSADAQRMRLLGYLPFVYPLLHVYPQANVLDLNVGASPWLQLLGEVGFKAASLNMNEPALLTQLAQLPDQSQAIVSAFRLVEYLPFDHVRLIVQESLRILKPGGLLLLEAPNPENLVLGAGGYYAIPNRQPPVMPELLEFVPQYYGYARTKVVRRLDRLKLDADQPLRLIDVLSATSPSYAVIAQKSVADGAQSPVIPAFAQEYGLKLGVLADRFDQDIDQQISKIRADAAQTELNLQNAFNELEASFLWRISSPIRWADNQIKRLSNEGVGNRIRAFRQKMVRVGSTRLLRLCASHSVLERLLKKRLEALVRASQDQAAPIVHVPVEIDVMVVEEAYRAKARIETLSAEARAIDEVLRAPVASDHLPRQQPTSTNEKRALKP